MGKLPIYHQCKGIVYLNSCHMMINKNEVQTQPSISLNSQYRIYEIQRNMPIVVKASITMLEWECYEN